jgi:hypothetical protein
MAVALSGGALLIASQQPHPSEVTAFQAGNVNGNGSLFAAAPPHGQVLGQSVVADRDVRSQILRKFLQSHNSPMANHAGTFVTVADKYDLDWRLLPAIAGAESSFGKYIPKNSFNAWGWGIPTGAQRGLGFGSWDDGIETVGRGLRRGYLDRGLTTLRQMEARYTPPSASQPDHPWVASVEHFMLEIENYQ